MSRQSYTIVNRNIRFLFLFIPALAFAQSWNQQSKIVASDRSANDNFGTAVAISGDYAIVGSHYEVHDASGGNALSGAGAAYIYVRSGSSWSQQQKIVASDRKAFNSFGYSVAISGDYAIIGSVDDDFNSSGEGEINNAGSVYIFVRSGSTWTEQQKLVASDRAALDNFGYSVAISGDYAVVGAPFESEDALGLNTLSHAGSSYIFVRNGSSWSQQQKIVASDRTDAEVNFGYSVSMSGDYAIIGAPYESKDASGGTVRSEAGSAYIFVRSGSSWSQQQKLVTTDRNVEDRFGFSAAISGDYAVVGAYNEDEDANGGNTVNNAGSAYVFMRNGSAWTQQQKLVAEYRYTRDYFGNAVAISGDYAIIGETGDDYNSAELSELTDAGSAYIFFRDGSSWNQQQKIGASDRAYVDAFAYSVGISGAYAVVGAYNEDEDASGNNNLVDAGSAYIFYSPAVLPVELQSFTGIAKGKTVELTWQTATEVNNYGFEIERLAVSHQLAAESGLWQKVGFVEGAGNSNIQKSYSFVDGNASGKVLYRLKQIDNDGKFEYSSEVEVTIAPLPQKFALMQNYPNPFNPATKISFMLPTSGFTTLKVHDVLGREVAILVSEEKEAGYYSTTFDGTKLSSGIYFMRLQTGDKVELKKMMLIK